MARAGAARSARAPRLPAHGGWDRAGAGGGRPPARAPPRGRAGMRAALARALIALATACLGYGRREWALAMQAELEAAAEHDRPIAFAAGCLLAAWREMPRHEE